MQRKTKIALVSVFGFMVVVVVGLTIATPYILKNLAKKQTEQLQAELQKDIAAAALSINVGLFPAMKDLGDAYEVIFEIPEVQELEIYTEVVDQKLNLSGKLTVIIERNSNGYRGTSSTSRDFSFSLSLDKPVDESAIVTKREEGRIIVTLPKAE